MNILKLFRKDKEQIVTKMFVLTCAFVVAALPFSIRLTSKAILLLSVIWFFHVSYKHLFQNLKNRWIWLYLLPYFLVLISMVYTQDIKAGLGELEKATPLLVLPILLGTIKPFKREEIQTILRSFIYSNLFFGICILAHASFKYLTEDVNIFYNFDLVMIFESHPTYYSMYILFSLACLVYLHKRGINRTAIERSPWLIGLIVIFFSTLIFLLSVRFIFLIYLTTGIALILLYIRKTQNVVKGVLLLTLLIGLVAIVFVTNDVLRERFMQIKESYSYQLSPDHQEGYNGFTTRLAQWESSLSIISKAPILGVGPGDVQRKLQEAYKANYLKYSYRDKLNAHNQYVQTTLGVGLVGLLALLATLFFPGILALRQRNYIVLSFLILFSLCCITESMLYVQKGIVFFGFFNALFTFHMLVRPRTKSEGIGPSSQFIQDI